MDGSDNICVSVPIESDLAEILLRYTAHFVNQTFFRSLRRYFLNLSLLYVETSVAYHLNTDQFMRTRVEDE